jgi:hypothetical protein
MSYWLEMIIAILVGYLLTELYYRYKYKRTINVLVVDKDGTRRVVKVTKGRDKEDDELISSIKKGRKLV